MNAIEILETRQRNRAPYHTCEWWQEEWDRHHDWLAERATWSHPAPAVTGYECTPATGKVPR